MNNSWEDDLRKDIALCFPFTDEQVNKLFSWLKPRIHSLLKEQWVDVKDRLPADGRYIVFAPDSVFEATIEGNNWYDCSGDEAEKITDVTHWMPLPNPPKPSKEKL